MRIINSKLSLLSKVYFQLRMKSRWGFSSKQGKELFDKWHINVILVEKEKVQCQERDIRIS